ncbi:MAG: sulfate adenylyltransferase subunit CysN [Pseudomonadota bacterium]
MAISTELLRFTTAGSVDDGKSTLIGRLLFDAKSIFEDQISAIAKTTKRRGTLLTNEAGLDLALLTDGLLAEREQGITIDVAYRYFATPKRKFIIADTPGHEQYTRNMVTGASSAQLAIVLVDARKGVLTQSRRHAIIASLLGIPHVAVAVNKMDLVDYSQEIFETIRQDFEAFADKLAIRHLHFVPISALLGDMVVERGESLNWYSGPTLLELLENVDLHCDDAPALRFPVQLVSRPQTPELIDFRGYMGRIESGSVKKGDAVQVLPSGLETKVKEIVTLDGSLDIAEAPQSVTLLLEDEIDISRGDMLVHLNEPPRVTKEFAAMLCWMGDEPLNLSHKYLIKQTTNTVRALFQSIDYRLDINTVERDKSATEFKMNDIGQVRIKVQKPIVCDTYIDNRATGSFIVIDEATNHTVAAGMILPEEAIGG